MMCTAEEILLSWSLTVFGKNTALKNSMICKHKQLEVCFSLHSACFSSNIWFEVFRFVFSSISVHTLCWFHLLYKDCTFQSLEITLPSYCHHVLPSEQQQFGFGASVFCSLMFPQSKQFCHSCSLLAHTSIAATTAVKMH